MLKLFRADPLNAAKLDTLDRAFAIVEFSPRGEILRSNPRFRDLVSYSESELLGSHHRLLVPAHVAESGEYRAFWERLGRGEYVEGEFERVRKGGARLIVHGVYNPVRDAKGQVSRVLKVALDVTAEKRRALEAQAKLDAIDRMQGVVELSPDGVVIGINDMLLAQTGYTRDEAMGQPHRVFLDPRDAANPCVSAWKSDPVCGVIGV